MTLFNGYLISNSKYATSDLLRPSILVFKNSNALIADMKTGAETPDSTPHQPALPCFISLPTKIKIEAFDPRTKLLSRDFL